MNLIGRWLRFSLVGTVGTLVQLSTLAILNCIFPKHYLLTTSAAIELTLTHNFIWHLRYTWRDRAEFSQTWKQFVRFHVANGLISISGNLLLMRLLVNNGHLHVVIANALAILACSVANFCTGHLWAFSLGSLGVNQ